MYDQLLVTLAVLKADWDTSSKSYLDNFVPFVVDAMRSTGRHAVPITDVPELVRSRFGVSVPEGVLNTVVRKAVKAGYGTRVNGTFEFEADGPGAPDLTPKRERALRELRALLDRLVRFARDELNYELTEEEAEQALLAHVGRHAVPLLRLVVAGGNYEATLVDEESDRDFVVSCFILHISSRDPEAFEYFEGVVKGSMLASVLYLPTPAEADSKFHDTNLFFDTRVILRALGYEGEAAAATVRDMLGLAYRAGAGLCCLRETADELRGVLTAAGNAVTRRGSAAGVSRGVESYFLEHKLTPSDIELRLARLDRDIRDLRIRILDGPPVSAELSVDEAALEADLEASVRYWRRETLLHDLDALTAMYRLRRGTTSQRLELARAVFVTANTSLVQVAQRSFYGSNDRRVWPVAMSDHDLATIVWLKFPAEAPSLPRRQVIADCLAAMEPAPHLWQSYLNEVDKLKDQDLSDEDYFVLRYATEAKQSLMEITRGNPQYVSPELVERVLGEARDAIGQPHRDAATAAGQSRADAEARMAATELELRAARERQRDLEGHTSTAELELRAARERLLELEGHASTAEAVVQASRNAIRNRATGRSRHVGTVVLGLLVVVELVAIWLGLPGFLGATPESVSFGWRVAAWIVVALGAAGIGYWIWTDSSPKQFARRIELAVEKRLIVRYERQAGLPPDLATPLAES